MPRPDDEVLHESGLPGWRLAEAHPDRLNTSWEYATPIHASTPSINAVDVATGLW